MRHQSAARALGAGATYFVLVFVVAFGVGVVRTLLIVPRTGALVAVAMELPVLLGVSWVACGYVLRRFGLTSVGTGERLAMGALAFLMLMAAEFGLAALLGRAPSVYWRELASAPGALGLAGQVGFAAVPLVRRG